MEEVTGRIHSRGATDGLEGVTGEEPTDERISLSHSAALSLTLSDELWNNERVQSAAPN